MNVEYVDVLTAGGIITIDATSSSDNGYVDLPSDWNAHDVLHAVALAVRTDRELIDKHGYLTLVTGRAALAYSYYEADSRLLEPRDYERERKQNAPISPLDPAPEGWDGTRPLQ